MIEQPRFIVHVSEGFRTDGNRGGKTRQPGITVSVHDQLVLCQTVALFRSEDYIQPRGRFGALKQPQMKALAIGNAARLAAKLNAAVAE